MPSVCYRRRHQMFLIVQPPQSAEYFLQISFVHFLMGDVPHVYVVQNCVVWRGLRKQNCIHNIQKPRLRCAAGAFMILHTVFHTIRWQQAPR